MDNSHLEDDCPICLDKMDMTTLKEVNLNRVQEGGKSPLKLLCGHQFHEIGRAHV